MEPIRREVGTFLNEQGVTFQTILGAAPDAPREDLYRIALQLSRSKANVTVAIGGGSTIDAVKAAAVLATYSSREVQKAL